MTIDIKESTCHLCLAYCGIRVTINNGVFTKIVSDFDNPRSQGYICEKAQKLIEFQHSKNRIVSPLKKVNNEFINISWDQAIDEICGKLKIIRGNNREDKIFYMASALPDFRSIYRYELMKRLGVKFVSNIFSMEQIYPAVVTDILFNAGVLPDIKNAQTCIVIGKNPWVTQHFPQARRMLNDIKNDETRTLIVIDPCDTETTAMADYHLKIKPGTDVWLLSALIKIIIDNNYINSEFIQTRTENFDKVVEHFSKLDLAECLTICGIAYNQLLSIAKTINLSSGMAIYAGNGICHSLNPFANTYLITLLYMITGNFQKLGAMNLNDNTVLPNMISDHYFTESHVPFGNQKQISGVTSASLISDNLYINDLQKFDCVIIDNNNPASRFPDTTKFSSQLDKVDMVIALDSFETPSTRLADYVLPVPTFFESYEIPSVFDDNLFQLSEPIVLTENKSAEEIFELLLSKLDLIDTAQLTTFTEMYYNNKTKFFEILLEKYNNKEPVVYYIIQHVLGPHNKNKILDILWWKFFVFINPAYDIEKAIVLSDKWVDQINNTGWTKLLHSNITESKINLTPGYLLSTLKLSTSGLSDPKYKFILQCGYRQKNSMNGVIPNFNEPLLEISKEDMEQLLINNNERVIIQTDSSELEIKCSEVKNLQQGLLRIANHAIINKLTNTKNRDYLNPQYKFVFANIRKI